MAWPRVQRAFPGRCRWDCPRGMSDPHSGAGMSGRHAVMTAEMSSRSSVEKLAPPRTGLSRILGVVQEVPEQFGTADPDE